MIAAVGGFLLLGVLVLAGLALLPHAAKGAPLAWRLLKWPLYVGLRLAILGVILLAAAYTWDEVAEFADAHLKGWAVYNAALDPIGKFWLLGRCEQAAEQVGGQCVHVGPDPVRRAIGAVAVWLGVLFGASVLILWGLIKARRFSPAIDRWVRTWPAWLYREEDSR